MTHEIELKEEKSKSSAWFEAFAEAMFQVQSSGLWCRIVLW